jgi:hypothetical protein
MIDYDNDKILDKGDKIHTVGFIISAYDLETLEDVEWLESMIRSEIMDKDYSDDRCACCGGTLD